MSELTREVSRLLRSDKVTERKKGRKDCEALLIKDKTNVTILPILGPDLLRGVLTYEELEIKYARSKNKGVELDVALFVHKVIRHFISSSQKYMQVIVTTADRERMPCIGVVISWILENLKDQRHELPYREEHRNILSDLLDYRVSHSLALLPHLIINILKYLQDAMIDKLSVNSKSHQRLLKQLCRILFSDDESVAAAISNLIPWLCGANGLFSCVSDEAKAEADLAVTAAECCTVLIEYHGLNIADLAFQHMKLLLQVITRQLPLQCSRDTFRDPYTRFLRCYLNLTIQACSSLSCGINEGNPLISPSGGANNRFAAPVHVSGQHSIASSISISSVNSSSNLQGISAAVGSPTVLSLLCIAMSQEDCLKYLIHSVTSTNAQRQSVDSYINPLDDPRVRLYIDTVATAYCLEHLHHISMIGRGTQRTEYKGSMLSSGGAVWDSSLGHMHARISKFSVLNTNANISKSDPSEAKTHPIMMEAYLLILQSLSRLFPRSEFLISNLSFFPSPNGLSRKHRLDAVCLTISALREKLEESLMLHNRQLIGGLLLTLSEFVRLSAALFSRTELHSDSGPSRTSEQNVRKEWSAVISLLLRESSITKFGGICKRSSVSECYLGLINAILEFEVLDSTLKWNMQQPLWTWMEFVRDPRMAESAMPLFLLANMIRRSGHELPQALCQTLLMSVSAQELSRANTSQTEDFNIGGAGSVRLTGIVQGSNILAGPARRSVVQSLPAEALAGKQLVTVYIICWLEHQLDARLGSRVPISSSKSVCEALDSLVQEVLPPVRKSARTSNIRNAGQTPVAADGMHSPLSGVNWFDDSDYCRTTALSLDLDSAECTRDEDIFSYLGANLATDAYGRVCFDPPGFISTSRGTNSPTNTTEMSSLHEADFSKKGEECILAELEYALRVLSSLRELLLTADVIRSQCAEAGESLAQWQLVCLFLSSVYASLAVDAERKCMGCSPKCLDGLKALLLFAAASFWSLVDVQVAAMKFRIGHQKWSFTADYMHELSQIVQRVSQLHAFSTKNQKGVYADMAMYRKASCEELLDLLKLVRDSTLVGSAAMDNESSDDFDRDEGESRGAEGNGANKRKRMEDMMFDDDFLEEEGDRSHSTSVPLERSGSQRGLHNEADLGAFASANITCKLFFSAEKLRTFSACTAIYMVASFDHEHVYDVLPILQERQTAKAPPRAQATQLGRFGMSLEILSKSSAPKGHPTDCKLWTASDVMLSIASSLSSVYSLNAIYYFFVSSGWDVDWGPLGYYKVLCVVYDLTRRAGFMMISQLDETHADILAKLIDIIFAQDLTLKKFPALLWRVRFMQLKCASNILAIENKFKDEPGYISLNKEQKTYIRHLFTYAVQEDPDIRVRLCAAARVSLVLKFFKKADAIYESLVDTSNLDKVSGLHSRERVSDDPQSMNVLYGATDPLQAVSNAVLIARMGASSPILTQRALLDLLRLCCTRIASNGCTSTHHLEAALCSGQREMQSDSNNSLPLLISLSESAGRLPCFASLLYRLLIFMSRSLGYSAPDVLLREHSRWIFRVWIVDLKWSLRALPVQLFMPLPFTSTEASIECIVGDTGAAKDMTMDMEEDADLPVSISFRCFLQKFGTLLVPILCQIPDKSRRWAAFSQFAQDVGIASTDHGIARLLLDSALSIQANAFLLIALSDTLNEHIHANGNTNAAEAKYGPLANESAERMLTFLGLAESSKINENSFKFRSDLVQEMARLYSTMAAHEYEPFPQLSFGCETEGLLNGGIPEKVLVKGLSQICDRFCQDGRLEKGLNQYKVTDLLKDCNIIEIMSELHARAIETLSAQVQLSILNVVHIFHDHLSAYLISKNAAGYRAVLMVITTLARRAISASVLKATCNTFARICDMFLQECTKVSNETPHELRLCNGILVELFCINACVLHALQSCRIRGKFNEDDEEDFEDFDPNGPLVKRCNAVLNEAVPTNSFEGFAIEDPFATIWCEVLLARALDSAAESTAKWKKGVNQSIRVLCGCLQSLLNASSPQDPSRHLDLAALLPLPLAFVNGLSTACTSTAHAKQYSLSSEYAYTLYANRTPDKTSGPNSYNLSSTIKLFINDSAALFRGEAVPLPVIWLRLLNIGSRLEVDLNMPSITSRGRDEGSNDVSLRSKVKSLWYDDPDLTGSFVSCLVRLSSFESADALRNRVMSFLGHIGPPDVQSLSHTGLPSRIGDMLVESGSNIHSLKTRIFIKVCSLLWEENPNTCRLASAALRTMNSLKCLGDEHMESIAPKIGRTCDNLLSAFTQVHLKPPGGQLPLSAGDPWSPVAWCTEGKTYSAWVCSLTEHIIRTAYSLQRNKLVSPSKTSKKLAPNKTKNADMANLAQFAISLREVCLWRHEIAEALLPLILFDIASRSDIVSSKVSALLTRHLLSPSCPLMEATRLGCTIVTFFLRQNITEFSRKSRTQLLSAFNVDPTRSQAQKSQSSSDVGQTEAMFTTTLHIDLIYAAEAANRCGCVCTALLMAELSYEHSRGSMLCSDAGSDTEMTVSAVDTSSITTRETLRGLGSQPRAAALLLRVFRNIHDPDALLGLLTEGSALEVQAVVYAHTGSWVAALATFESLVQDENVRTQISPHLGMAQALQGLGSQHLLTAYASWCHTLGPSVGSHVPEILSLASEGSWRNINGASFSNTHSGSISPSTALAHAADSADASLRDWNGLDVPSGTVDRLVPDSYFNSSIASALCDMQRGDFSSAMQSTKKSAAALLPNIFASHTDESANGLLLSLVRAQQLFEVSEACRILSETTYAGSALGSDTAQSSVNALLTRWAARLDCTGGSSGAFSESILSLRLSLLSQLLERGAANHEQALQLMDQVLNCIPDKISSGSQAAAHALSPLAYKIKATLTKTATIKAGVSMVAGNIWNVQWAHQECRLMWKKGLEKIATSNLDVVVIKELKSMVSAVSAAAATHSKRSSRSIADGKDINGVNHLRNMLSSALRQGGDWMGLRRAATGTDILAEYLLPAVVHAVDGPQRIAAYTSVATFQDRLHTTCKARVESEEHRRLKRVNADRKEEYENCLNLRNAMTKEQREADVKLRRHIGTLKKEIDMDSQELQLAEESVSRYLLEALKGYAQVLAKSEDSDLDIMFRVISLWLKNREVAEVNAIMHDIIKNTRSFKFIPLTYQILSMLGAGLQHGTVIVESVGMESSSSRASISSTSSISGIVVSFSSLIATLVKQMAVDHPYHVLPQLFALVNGDDFGPGSSNSAPVRTNRIDAAERILSAIKAEGRALPIPTKKIHNSQMSLEQAKILRAASLTISLEVLLRAYINLANLPIEQFVKANRTTCIKFAEFQKRSHLFHKCLEPLGEQGHYTGVITLTPPLQKDGDYRKTPVVYIHSIESEFSITDSGLSRPKIIQVLASDGRTYKELVKGNDDMRQDAVMEQVFENVNITLAQNAETRKRKLSMRTYKCVPMTPQTGVIQWVENARPFGDYLMHKESGAHARYYPNDWTHLECREYLKAATDNQDKEKRLLDIYSKFHPAFRFFFLEKYSDPARWLSCRLAYTRSVAVASMLGYVLAIGDRHAQNIMLDVSTAEVVHIDFGIVFDQGKVLPTPETVPFRLTRDVIDGMGITGVEGTFKKSCEEVLRALRMNSAQILTILEVVIHDPLYKWSLSPIEARNKQDKRTAAAMITAVPNEDDTLVSGPAGSNSAPASAGRDAAERTLMRIRNKLQGFEDSTGEGLGVEGQVEQLIATARDTKNLSRIYIGWAPWL